MKEKQENLTEQTYRPTYVILQTIPFRLPYKSSNGCIGLYKLPTIIETDIGLDQKDIRTIVLKTFLDFTVITLHRTTDWGRTEIVLTFIEPR